MVYFKNKDTFKKDENFIVSCLVVRINQRHLIKLIIV